MDNDKMQLLLQAAKNYYNGEEYLLTDKEYDQLLSEAKVADPSFDIFKEIGYIGRGQDDNTDHSITFPPFGKSYMEDEYTPCEYIESGPYADYFREKENEGAMWFYKYDGCSLILYYNPETGMLQDIVTRSNEVTGKNRFRNFVRLVPASVPRGIRAILCEVMVPQRFGFGFTSRNKANGLTNSKYKIAEINEMCTVVGCNIIQAPVTEKVSDNEWVYRELYDFSKFKNKYEVMKTIPNKSIDGRISFYITQPVDVRSLTKFIGIEKVTAGSVTENFTMGVDGIVLYMDDYAEAYKAYCLESVTTTVRAIAWTPSDKEQLIPNIVIDPTEIEGTIIQNIATNGVSNLIARKIDKGTQIKVGKVGMVSPQVIKVLGNEQDPKLPMCSCGHQFTKDDILIQGLYCPNQDCHSKYENRESWFSNYDREKLTTAISRSVKSTVIDTINMPGPISSNGVEWTSDDIQLLYKCIDIIDVDTFIELVHNHYNISDIQNRVLVGNSKALLTVFNHIIYAG